MGLNQYDEAVEQLGDDQPNDYDQMFTEQRTSNEVGLRKSLVDAQATTPDRAAQARGISMRLGVPVDQVERNLEEYQKRDTVEARPYQQIQDSTPALADWIKKPENAKLAHDDLENLGALEWLLKAPSRAFAQGVNQVNFAKLRSKSLFQDLTQEEKDHLESYRYHMTLGGELGADNWLKGAVTGSAQQLPMLFGALLKGAPLAVAGGVTAGTAAFAAGPASPIAVPAAFTGGVTAGMMAGGGLFGFEVESGLAYDEFLAFKDELGQPLDPAVAKAAAIATGAINGGLEVFELQQLAKTIPGLGKLKGLGARSAVKQALRNPSIRAALGQAVKEWGGTVTKEALTEVAQRTTNILAGELAKLGTDIPHITPSQAAGELTQEFIGAVQSFALMTAGGPVVSVIGDVQRAKSAESNKQFFTALGQGVTQAKTSERLPAALQDFLASATKDGPIATVYAPTDTWATYWQEQGLDPNQVYTELTGDPDGYATAIRSGEDLAIPTSAYAARLAGTPHNKFFAEELRLAPDEMNFRESEVFKADQAAIAEEHQARELTPAETFKQQVIDTLVQGGASPAVAEEYATLHASIFPNMAERHEVDPVAQTLGDYGLEVTREGVPAPPAAAAPVVTETRSTGQTTEATDAAGRSLFDPTNAAAYAGPERRVAAGPAPEAGERRQGQPGAAAGASGAEDRIPVNELPAAEAAARMRREDPQIDRRAKAMAAKARATPRISEQEAAILAAEEERAKKVESRSNAATSDDAAHEAGPGPEDAGDQRAGADGRRVSEGSSDGPGAERRGIPAADEVFEREPAERAAERIAAARPQLEWILDELDNFKATDDTWTWLGPGRADGNVAGGHADKVAGIAGAPVYHDILAHAPVNTVSSGKRKGEAAHVAHGSRGKVEAAIRKALETNDISNNLAEGAVRVAERRKAGDWKDLSPAWLPSPTGKIADEGFTNALSEAVDALEGGDVNMLENDSELSDSDLEQLAGGDTSFNIHEFDQSLFDDFAEATKTVNRKPYRMDGVAGWWVKDADGSDKLVPDDQVDGSTGDLLADSGPVVDTLDTGEEQPRLPGAGDVRDQDVKTPEFDAPFSLTSPAAKGSKGRQTTLFQAAYHGSPHRFEKFSLHAIGTGEGAQVYGWGLYFAGNREVAEYYRDRLSQHKDAKLTVGGEAIAYKETGVGNENTAEEIVANRLRAKFGGALGDLTASQVAQAVESDIQRSLEMEQGRKGPIYESLLRQRRVVESWIDKGIEMQSGGTLYTVDIPDDTDMLDWDKPASQQPPKVQAALRALGVDWTTFKPKSPAMFLRWFEGQDAQQLWREDIGIREALSQAYHFATTGQVEALNNWQNLHQGYFPKGMIDPTGETIYGNLGHSARETARHLDLKESAKFASLQLNQLGVAGIKYLDGSSRAQGAGTSNYVVFDEKLVEITEFNQSGIELTRESVKTWADELKERIGDDLAQFEVYLTNLGDLHLSALMIERGAQRAGLGTKVMQELTRFADLHGKRLTLKPGVRDTRWGTTSRARLVTFYKRFGFVENKGRNKDFTIDADAMLREPTIAAAGQQPAARDNFGAWFGESKVVDAAGKPLVVHHGTARGDRVGNVFRKSRATSGPMAFFTTDKAIATKYSEQKVDTSLELPDDYGGWFKFKPKGSRTEVNLDRAWWHLTAEQRATVIERLPTVGYENHEQGTGPIVNGTQSIAGKDHIDFTLKREAKGNGLTAAKEIWLSSGSLFDQEEKFVDVLKALGLEGFRFDDPHRTEAKVFDVYLSIQNPLDTSNIPADVIAALEKVSKQQRRVSEYHGADFWDKKSRDPIEWMDAFKADQAAGKNSYVWSSIPDWVTKTLKGLGYDGIKDLGGKMGGEEHNVWIPFESTQVKSTENAGSFNPNDPNIYRQEKRGAIRFGSDKQFTIALYERADLSTFLHESGHFYLEVFGDLVDKVNAQPLEGLSDQQRRLVSDYGTLLQFLGVENRGDIGVEQHEKFARAFEAYLMKGEAPSLELRQTFARFRAWLLGIYRSLKNLNVELTPEVTKVFDRMVASDKAIAMAEQEGKLAPMFLTAAAAGMTEADFSLYRSTVERASQAAREQLDRQLIDEVNREQQAEWKAQRAELQTAVETEVYARPVYQALSAMQRGTQPNGEPMVDGLTMAPVKLSRAILVDRYGADRLKRLPKPYVYSSEGGLDPDVVATMFGFSSGDELLTAIEQAPPMRALIQQETEQRMLREHGSILLDGSLLERAQGANANEDRELVLRAEIRALGQLRRTAAPFVAAGEEKLAAEKKERAYERRWLEAEAKLRIAIAEGKKQEEIDALTAEVKNLRQKARGGAATINAALPPAGLLRDTARARLARTRIRDIKPAVFWATARRAAQQAIDSAARQDFEGAIAAKQQELIQLALYREAQAAVVDVEARTRQAKDLARPAARQKLGLAGEGYLDQVDGILDRYDFAKASPKVLERRAALRKWAEGLEANGLPVDLSEELLDEARRVNYQDLPLEEFVGVTDGLKHILHLARLKNRLLKAAADRELAQVVDSVATSVREHKSGRPPVRSRDRAPSSERGRTVEGFFASHRKLASFVREMDGLEDGGAVWTAIMKPINDAGAKEAEMNAAATKALGDLINTAYPKQEKRTLYAKVHVAAVDRSLSKMERLMIALNWGNDGNRQRVRSAEKWNDQQVQAILDTLDARDWRFVQGTWDYIDTFWPDIAAKQERVTGIAPEKVAATPVRTPFGEQRGGYFPLKYDDRLSATAAGHLDLEAGTLQRQAAYVKATTKRGHTKERAARVTLPIRLDFGVLFEHVGQVIHDLSHHEMLIDVGRVLGHRDVQTAIYETYGDVIYKQMKDAIKDIAFGDVPATNAFERSLNHLRAGATVAGLGWNLTTAFLQPLGLTNSIVRIGPKWVAKGAGRWIRDAATMENSIRFIESKSPFMKTRGLTQQREINEIRNSIGVNTGKLSGWVDAALQASTRDVVSRQGIADSFFWMIQTMQRVADVPTWLGQYEKSRAAGETEERSAAIADQAVLDSQGGGQVKDLAQVQRGGPMLRLWTNFYSFFNVLYNQTIESHRGAARFNKPGAIGRLGVDYLLLYIVPATLGYAVRQAMKPGDDDDTEWIEDLVRENIAYPMGTILGLRELSGAVQGYYGYEGPAGARAFAAASKLVQQAQQGEADAAFWRALNDVAGILFHYPSGQTRRTIEGVAAMAEGKTQNPGALVAGAPK